MLSLPKQALTSFQYSNNKREHIVPLSLGNDKFYWLLKTQAERRQEWGRGAIRKIINVNLQEKKCKRKNNERNLGCERKHKEMQPLIQNVVEGGKLKCPQGLKGKLNEQSEQDVWQ